MRRRSWRIGRGWPMAFLLTVLLVPAVLEAGAPYAGRPLADVLSDLEQQGLPLVFSSAVVTPAMRVEREPRGPDLRAVLAEVLGTHGLTVRPAAGRWVVVPEETSDAAREPVPAEQPAFALPITLDEIVVTPSTTSLLAEEASTWSLGRDAIERLPRFADDVVRSLGGLAGASGNDTSARLSIRGGREDELLVELDGVELLEPFHLKDFNSPFSILAPNALSRVELITGGFSAEYGDRLSGVLDMTSSDLGVERRRELALSLFNAQALFAGQGRRPYLVSLRGGSLEPALEVADQEENPTLADGFVKIAWPVPEGHSLLGQALLSDDRLDFAEPPAVAGGSTRRFRTRYISGYGWATHQRVRPRSALETRVSWSHLQRDRSGNQERSLVTSTVEDRRRSRVAAFAHDALVRIDERSRLRFGVEARHLRASYDYQSTRALDDRLVGIGDSLTAEGNRFDQTFDHWQGSAYVTARRRFAGRVTLEGGLRFDLSTVTDESSLAPRLNLAWSMGKASTLRVAWGHYFQSHRLHELRVEDGESVFQQGERAEHRILGIDHVFGTRRLGPLSVRLELYDRRVDDPRPRYDNLFDSRSIVPELEADRVRVDALRSRAHGAELTVRGAWSKHTRWSLGYVYARSRDRVSPRPEDPRHWVPRPFDQPHTILADADVDLPWRVRLHLAWRWHTGGPTTSVAPADPLLQGGGVEQALRVGLRNEDRLPDFERLDLRLSRTWRAWGGELEAYLSFQNLLRHGNILGFEVDLAEGESGVAGERLVVTPREGFGIVPWAGVRWRF